LGLGIFVLALGVRLFCLWEVSHSPTFDTPIIDSGTYHQLASDFATGHSIGPLFFWQAFFYPAFLSSIYTIAGPSITLALVVQALLAAILCVLVFILGTKVLNRSVGVIAGVIVAVYGPLVFFSTQLLSTVWTVSWPILLILISLRAKEKPGWLWCTLCGCVAGLSIVTHGVFVPFAVAAGLWLTRSLFVGSRDKRKTMQLGGAWAAGLLLVLLPVSFLSHSVTGRFSPLPPTGAINLVIGNNPERPESAAVRPGGQWEELLAEAHRDGAKMYSEVQAYFMNRYWDYIATEPLLFIYGLAHKSVQFISSREIPNTYDLYIYRKYSSVLSLLAWKLGSFGFPFGVLFPLALLGIVASARRMPGVFFLFLVVYPLSVVLVFTSARYRAPVVPVLAIFAGAGALRLMDFVRARKGKLFGSVVLALAAAGFIIGIGGPFSAERVNYEAEMQACLGWEQHQNGRFGAAVGYYRAAIELQPDYAQAHFNLGRAYLETARYKEALEHLEVTRKLHPDRPKLHLNLGNASLLLGDVKAAIHHYEREVQDNPEEARAHYNLGAALRMQGSLDRAAGCFRQALELRPDLVVARLALANLFAVQQQTEKAKDQLEWALLYTVAGNNPQMIREIWKMIGAL
jgi:tetratricopeptide (TPR) repeat protein